MFRKIIIGLHRSFDYNEPQLLNFALPNYLINAHEYKQVHNRRFRVPQNKEFDSNYKFIILENSLVILYLAGTNSELRTIDYSIL